MISFFRMKIDVLGQAIIISACILVFFFRSGMAWTNAMLLLLAAWQFASAVHLYYSYQYILKINYLRTALVIGISIPIWAHLLGKWAYLPVAGVVVWYFIQTLRDTIIVARRPKSFWDIE